MLTLMRNGGHVLLPRAPDDGDGDGGMKDADQRAMRAIKDKLEQRATQDEDDDDGDDFEVQVGPATHAERDDDEPPPSRTERRRERGGLHSEVERLRGEVARLSAVPAQARQQPPPPQGPSIEQIREVLDNEFVRIQNEELELERTVSAHVTAKSMTPETLEALKAKQRQLVKDKALAQHRWAEMEDGSIMRRFQPQQPQVDPAVAALNAEYADVAQDPRASSYANGYYAREVAKIQMGERAAVPPYQLRREAWQAGRGILEGRQPSATRRPAPTNERKAKYTGMSTNSQGGNGAPAGVKNVFITPQEDLMAQERFKHLKTPAERRKAFVKEMSAKKQKREQAQ